ncbi:MULTISPECIES: KdsC family phosphatase [unclassified Paraflavitalea]|uniref:KdsC family phosphatase n=1 Tax=unclassified Paraflavitalea TaxID=2798305 RepID=UPI003D356B0F
MSVTLLDDFKQINTFVFDMDGVLTDGTLFVFENNEFIRRMNIKDGYALQLAVKRGYHVLVISGAVSEPVKTRLNGLGISNVYMKVKDKTRVLHEFVESNNISLKQCLYMGDDIPDLEVMKMVGLATAPSDAVEEIKSVSHYISPYKGGMGCVRDVIEKVMKLNNDWYAESEVTSR